ncbi:MAG TPA: phage holin family protein [Candidatus Paceibacterota bacterium]|jgi:putative membrane protein|nr:phage holin family protein [Candidatus Paceibacterota bacterium]
MKLFIHWIVSAIAIIVAAYLIPGVHVTILSAFVLAIVLGIINIFLKPIISLITLPINILTLGLFSLVVNALLILLAAMIVPNFTVDGFWWALLFSLVLSLVNAVFHAMAHRD